MDAAVRYESPLLTREMLPERPAVYAWYREGRRIYVGKADSLRRRLWRDNLGRSRSLGTSAFRRNVAEHLGYGQASEIKTGIIAALYAAQEAGNRTLIRRFR